MPNRQRGYAAVDLALHWLSSKPTPATSSLDGIRLYEARASRGYYAPWRGLRLQLDSRADTQWPPLWKVVGERKSPLTRWFSPRQATNLAQAMLNFCYALLESQTRQALNAIGADVVCGILHGDRDGRDSLVYDVMEPLRGPTDSMLLDFISAHTFGAGDFVATTTGAVTLHPNLARAIAQMVRVDQRHADDQARWIRAQLLGGSDANEG